MQDGELAALEGISKRTRKKLEAAGIRTIYELIEASFERLAAYGIGKRTWQKVRKAALAWGAEQSHFHRGAQLKKDEESRQYLTSGTQELDRVLGGRGFETGQVYEVYGLPGVGKSNLLFQCICTAFLPPARGGLGGGTVFIDTEDTFALPRVREIARRFGIDPQELQPRIRRTVPPTSDFLIYVCETQVRKMMAPIGARLICLDSIATPLRAEYGTGLDRLPERQQKAALVLRALKRLAQFSNGVVLITNQTTVRADVLASQDATKHALGFVVGQGVAVRLKMRMLNNRLGACEVSVEKAMNLAPFKCEIYLGAEGFFDDPNMNRSYTNKRP